MDFIDTVESDNDELKTTHQQPYSDTNVANKIETQISMLTHQSKEYDIQIQNHCTVINLK